MKLVARRTKSGICMAGLLLSGVAMHSAAAQPPQTAAGRPALSTEEADRLVGGPTLVTLHVKEAAPKDVFTELARQSGLEFKSPPRLWEREQAKVPVTADIERQPFWVAMRLLAAKTEFYLDRNESRMALSILRGSDRKLQGVAILNGPFLVIANEIEQRLSLPNVTQTAPVARLTAMPAGNTGIALSTPPARQEFRLTLSVFVDPKLRAVPQTDRIKLDEVVDEKGNSLLRPDAQEMELNGSAPAGMTVALDLNRTPSIGYRIARLRGTLRLMAVVGREVFTVPDVMNAKDTGKSIATVESDRRYVVHEVKKVGDRYQVRLSLARTDLISEDSLSPEMRQSAAFLTTEAFRSVRLLDDKGRDLSLQDVSGGGKVFNVFFKRDGTATAAGAPTAGGTATAASATAVGEPVTLRWEIPTETRDITVPFEFTNLPLP